MDQSDAVPDAPRPPDSPAAASTPAPGHAWGEELGRAHDTSDALAVGRFTLDGEPIYLNRGMCTVLGGATPDRPRRDYLVNPSFAQLLAGGTEGLLFAGWLTVGDGYRTSRTLHGQVYRKGAEVLILGEYDVVELDRFKPINDTHGHAAGDTVLQSVAQRLKRSVRDTDSVARLGGDEFVVVLRDVEAPEHARQVAHEIQAALIKPIWLSGLSVGMSASIGIALGPLAGETAEDLLHRADQAMYAAKRVRPPPHPLPGRMGPLASRRGHLGPEPLDQAGD